MDTDSVVEFIEMMFLFACIVVFAVLAVMSVLLRTAANEAKEFDEEINRLNRNVETTCAEASRWRNANLRLMSRISTLEEIVDNLQDERAEAVRWIRSCPPFLKNSASDNCGTGCGFDDDEMDHPRQASTI